MLEIGRADEMNERLCMFYLSIYHSHLNQFFFHTIGHLFIYFFFVFVCSLLIPSKFMLVIFFLLYFGYSLTSEHEIETCLFEHT